MGRLVVRSGGGGVCGDLAGMVSVVHGQHGSEHGAVVAVEPCAERGEHLLPATCGVLLAPFRDGGTCPVQISGLILAEPHGVPSPASARMAPEDGLGACSYSRCASMRVSSSARESASTVIAQPGCTRSVSRAC